MEPLRPAELVRRYRKRPVEVEAALVTTENQLDVAAWCGGLCRYNEVIEIQTLEGVMTAQMGDYVIRGVKGEFYPCKPDIFLASYKELEGWEVGDV